MALIKCPECGKEVSDTAISCPNCGKPMKIENCSEGNVSRTKKPTLLGFVAIICGIIAIYCCSQLFFGLAAILGFGGIILCVVDIYENRKSHNIITSIIGIIVCLLGMFDIFF